MEDDEDVPTLSLETFTALQEFYAEQQKRQEIVSKLKVDEQLKGNIHFEENWQLSQFWYDDTTVQSLVKVADSLMTDGGKVALVSCPTLFVPLKKQLGDKATVMLLEFDRRFEVHGENFVFYDYNFPEKLPNDLKHSFDLVISDPPFLSEECITKTSQTIKFLAKDKIVVCSGLVMKNKIEDLLELSICKFQPQHKNNLANEFSCYANFKLDDVLS